MTTYGTVEMLLKYLVNEEKVLKQMGYRRNMQNAAEKSQTCPVSSSYRDINPSTILLQHL